MAIPVIAPAGPLALDGLVLPTYGPTYQNLLADQPVVWTTNGGVLDMVTANSVRWRAPNRTGPWSVWATNGGDEVGVIHLSIQAIIPNYWGLKTPVTAKKDVQIFRPRYGPMQSRTWGDGSMQLMWDLKNEDSDLDRGIEMRAFWNYHHPGKPFDLWDPILNERRRYQTDSDMAYFYETTEGMSWGFRIAEAYPYAIINV